MSSNNPLKTIDKLYSFTSLVIIAYFITILCPCNELYIHTQILGFEDSSSGLGKGVFCSPYYTWSERRRYSYLKIDLLYKVAIKMTLLLNLLPQSN